VTTRYTLTWRSSARKDLKRLDRQVAARILPAIAALADDPRPSGVKRLKGDSDLWRIRVGGYRVVYAIEDDHLVVLVVAVAGRGAVYRDI
jgi:mRNA interferase RelE/StbE